MEFLKGPHIIDAKVTHKRTMPKVNAFTYGVYYLALPLSKLQDCKDALKLNKWSWISFYEKDHGYRDGEDLNNWAQDILGLNPKVQEAANGEIILVTMPRIFGYVFNPVSFWLCFNTSEELVAVICEVNNTFGETHSYLCAHHDGRAIKQDDIFGADKVFHVSPFLKREGSYTFRFAVNEKSVGVYIDFFNAEENKQLITLVVGPYEDMTRKRMLLYFIRRPLLTFKVITLIHWQAFKLIAKGIKHIRKPDQIWPNKTITD